MSVTPDEVPIYGKTPTIGEVARAEAALALVNEIRVDNVLDATRLADASATLRIVINNLKESHS